MPTRRRPRPWDWSTVAGDFPVAVLPWHGADLARRIREVADDYAHVVVDTGGENDVILSQALLVTAELLVRVERGQRLTVVRGPGRRRVRSA